MRETPDGVVVVAVVHLCLSELEISLGIQRSVRRRILNVQQSGDLALLVPRKTIRDGLLVIRINIIRTEELRQHLLIRVHGLFIILAPEITIGATCHGIFPIQRVPGLDIFVKPSGGLVIFLLLEAAVPHIVRQDLPLYESFHGRGVVQLGESFLRFLVVAGHVVGFRHTISCHLGKPVGLRQIIRRGLVIRYCIPVRSAGEKLLRAQEIGLGVIVLHVRRQYVNVVIRLHCSDIIPVIKSRQRHITVKLSTL